MLNYGDEENICETDSFVKLYKERFGDKFFVWRTTLPYDEYLKVMSEAVFYICANKTQTGLGAISNSIRQGKTIILRGDNFKWMNSLGVKVYDYDSLENLDFQTLNKLMLTNEETQVSLDNFMKNAIQKFTHEYWKDEILRCLE